VAPPTVTVIRAPGVGRGAVEVDQRVAGAVGPVAVGVAVRGRGGLLVGPVGVHVDVVLVAGGDEEQRPEPFDLEAVNGRLAALGNGQP